MAAAGAMGALLAVAGCGGGGGSDAPAAATPPAATGGTVTVVQPPTPPVVNIALSGTITFDYVPPASDGSLSYAATTTRPARGVTVELLDAAGAVLASTATDGSGAYAFSAPPSSALKVRARAELLKTAGAGGRWNTAVVDNTNSYAEYGAQAPIATGTADLVRNINIPSGWSGTAYTASRVAGPFALLDTLYAAQQKILAVAPTTVFPRLDVYWSINNTPSTITSFPTGQLQSTAFDTINGVSVIMVQGKADVDSDEYDASVIAHEWGHYFQHNFSRDDTSGGAHSFGESLDRRIAFSEGWGNAWSGILLGKSTYQDSYGAHQGSGVTVDLSSGPASNMGWFNEESIQYVLWQLNQTAGFTPIYSALTGVLRTSTALTDIHVFNTALQTVSPSAAANFAPLLAAQGISSGSDAWGVGETHDGGLALALPMYKTLVQNTPLTGVCVSNAMDPGDKGNKLGGYAYVRFTVATAGAYTVGVTGGPAASDPDFFLWRAGSYVGGRALTGASSETVTTTLPAGDYVMAVTDYNNSSASTCFTAVLN